MENVTSTEKNQNEKFTLIDSLITAMFIPKEYDKLLKLSTGKVLRYLLVVMLLVCLIQYAIPGMGAIAGLGGIEGIVINEIPEFSLEDGKFFLEESVERADEVSGAYFLIDTTVDAFDREDVPKNMIQAVLISESNILVYSSVYGFGAMADVQNFEMIKDVTLSNKELADMSGLLYAGLFCFFLLLYFASIVEYMITALVYSMFMFVIVKVVMQDLTFDTVYKVAIFAQTIGAIVVAITYSLGNELLYMAGGFFNVFITVSLMNKVILKLKLNEMQ